MQGLHSMIKWLYQHIFPSIGWVFIKLWTKTLKIQVHGEKNIDTLRKKGQKIVYVFWHGRQFILVQYMAHKHICIMSSTSRDGRLQASILSKFGYEIAFGSSHKSPVRALVGMVGKMREGWDAAFAVDGPRGPIYKVKPGAVFLAKKMNAVIIPLTFSSNRFIDLTAWDKYRLPLPFSTCQFIMGDPIYPTESLEGSTIMTDCKRIEDRLNEDTKLADTMIKNSGSIRE